MARNKLTQRPAAEQRDFGTIKVAATIAGLAMLLGLIVSAADTTPVQPPQTSDHSKTTNP